MTPTKILSVVIPYYQETAIELFLPLSSISGQLGVDFAQIECILVNDGSHNYLSEEFLALFAPLSINCIYLPENKGPGTARQTGIDNAAGEYVMFCDADDTLQNVFVLRDFLAEIARYHPEMIYSSLVMQQYDPIAQDYIYVGMDADFKVMHGRVYSLDYLRRKKIRFPEDLRAHEDTYFNMVADMEIQNLRVLRQETYMMRYRPGSVTRPAGRDHFVETMPDTIKCVGYILAEAQKRVPEKIHVRTALQILSFYFTFQKRSWLAPENTSFLCQCEQLFGDMIKPYLSHLSQVSADHFTSMYHQKRQKLFIGEIETEDLAGWLGRVTGGDVGGNPFL